LSSLKRSAEKPRRFVDPYPRANFRVVGPGKPEILGASYRESGHRESMSDATGTTTYTYDGFGQLREQSAPAGMLAFDYDDVGNKTQPDGFRRSPMSPQGLASPASSRRVARFRLRAWERWPA
jgi:hypothetical protein